MRETVPVLMSNTCVAYPERSDRRGSDDLFASASDNWRPEGGRKLSWIRTLAHEGGLFETVGRRTKRLLTAVIGKSPKLLLGAHLLAGPLDVADYLRQYCGIRPGSLVRDARSW